MYEELIKRIADGIRDCEAMKGTHVYLEKSDAVQLVKILAGEESRQILDSLSKNARIQFYCASCGKSFYADPREDQESFTRWHYHTWYAKCPWCRREVRQTDRYWR